MKRVSKKALAAVSLISAITVLSSCTDDLVNTSALYGPAEVESEQLFGKDPMDTVSIVYGPAPVEFGFNNPNGSGDWH